VSIAIYISQKWDLLSMTFLLNTLHVIDGLVPDTAHSVREPKGKLVPLWLKKHHWQLKIWSIRLQGTT